MKNHYLRLVVGADVGYCNVRQKVSTLAKQFKYPK